MGSRKGIFRVKFTTAIVFVACVAMVFLLRVDVVSSDPINANDLFRIYHDSLKHLESFSFDYKEKVMISRTGGLLALSSTSNGSVKFDRDRLWIMKKRILSADQSLDMTETVYSPEERLSLTVNQENLNVIQSEFAFLGNLKDDWNADNLTKNFPYPFILGYFRAFWESGYKVCRLNSFFLTAPTFEVVNVDNKPLFRIHGFVDDSNTKVETIAWFDPEYNFALCRVKFLVTFEGFSSPAIHEFIISDFWRIGDFYYPAKFVMKSSIPPRKLMTNDVQTMGDPYEHEISVELSQFSFNNTFRKTDFRITTNVPDYTAVFMQDAPQIKYVWLNGKIVPLSDDVALARARGHGFMPGPDSPRFWFVSIGILLLLIGAGRLAYRYFVRGEKIDL